MTTATSQTEALLMDLYGDLGAKEYAELRTISPEKKVGQHWVTSPKALLSVASRLSGVNLYFSLGVRRRLEGARGSTLRGDKEHTARVGAVYADVDFKVFLDGEAGAWDALKRFPLPPMAVIFSGGGLQPLWFLREPATPEDFAKLESINKGFTVALAPEGRQLDHAIDAARVFRLPDTFNFKYDPPRRTHLAEYHPDRRYNLSDLAEHLPIDYPPVEPSHSSNGTGHDVGNDLTAEQIISLARAAKNSPKFISLFEQGDLDPYQGDESRADQALVSLLTFYTNDPDMLDILFRRSALYREEKWGQRADYRALTIQKALQGRTEFYQPASARFTAKSSGAATMKATPGEETPWPPRELLPDLPSAPALPPSMVPAPLRPWLVDRAERACFPLELVAIPAMIALATVVGRSLAIRPSRFDDYLVVPNLWGGIVTRPGLMKSYAVQEGTAPLNRLAAAARERHQEGLAEMEARRDRLEAEIAAIKAEMTKTAKRDAGAFGTFATLEADLAAKKRELAAATVSERRYVTQDATVEKLGELLNENSRGLLVLRDELAGWLRTLDKPGREGDREFYLESWNGTGGYTFDRIGRGTVHIEALTLSICGGIQPGKLLVYIREATEGGWGADGLLQRLQLLVWPDDFGPWNPPRQWPDHDAKNRAFAIFERLNDAPTLVATALDLDERGIPYLHFSFDAQELFDTWRWELEHRLRSRELADFPAFESHLSKYRSLMPSLALLFHLVDVAAGAPVGPVTLQAAELAGAWCEFLEAHARKVYADELSPGIEAARALAAKVREGAVSDGTALRDVYQHHWGSLATAAAVRGGLDGLEAAGWLRVDTVETGGRPTEIIRLHPELRGGGAHE